jgi:uncharacterized protein YhfF
MSSWTGHSVTLRWEETEFVKDDLANDPLVRRFWQAYAKAARLKEAAHVVYAFGDNAELADELLELVVVGYKRTRTSLPRDFAARALALPKPGDLAVIVDGAGKPRCIVRTLHVETKRLRAVDAQFAWDSGGGDRSLEWWLSAHTRYFKRRGAQEGFTVDGDMEVVLERFEVVWPREIADAKKGRSQAKGQRGAAS